MRIAMIGQKGIPAMYGGIERHVEELSLELAKKGHNVLVYSRKWYAKSRMRNYYGVKIVYTPTLRAKHLDAIAHTFTSTIHALFQKPDVIHYHGVGPSLLCWLPRIFSPKTRVITTVHCLDRYHQKWGFFSRLMLRLGEYCACAFSHQTISVSKTIQNYCLNEYHKTTVYIPNGARMEEKQNCALLDQWNLEPQKYILMVSRLIKHKGAHYLIDAWQICRQQNLALKDYKLVIAGGGHFTDDYVENLKHMARGDNSVIFTGWQSGRTLSELYANAKLFVHPSENEGLPITVLQAMSFGAPVLVSDIPEHQEIITDSKFWFANANIYSLAEKITELMADQKLLEEAGRKNKETVEKNFNWENIAIKTISLYGAPQKSIVRKYKTA